MWLAVCLAVVILHNFLTALFIAVRMYRIVTALQFVQSLGFAAISLGLLSAWRSGATSVVIGYAVATILSAVGAVGWLRALAAAEPADVRAALPQGAFWAKLVPFAIWMWVTNLLANLFEVIDRYMIVHHSGMEANEALRQVGLLSQLADRAAVVRGRRGLAGLDDHAALEPRLGAGPSRGGRAPAQPGAQDAVALRCLPARSPCCSSRRFCSKSPFSNKFQGGLAVLPWTLTYCTWFGTIAVAQNYLWCAERPG